MGGAVSPKAELTIPETLGTLDAIGFVTTDKRESLGVQDCDVFRTVEDLGMRASIAGFGDLGVITSLEDA